MLTICFTVLAKMTLVVHVSFLYCQKSLFKNSFNSHILECNKASIARLRADQMEEKESVAKDHDKME